MLQKILEGVELPKFLLIKDYTSVRDDSCFLSCVANRCKQSYNVHCFLLEHKQFYLRHRLQPAILNDSNIPTLHDLCSDPYGWNTCINQGMNSTTPDQMNNVSLAILGQNNVVVAIDCVKVLQNDVSKTLYQNLIEIKNQKNIVQFILMVHADLLTPAECKVIDYLADAIVELTNEHLMVEYLRQKSAIQRKDGDVNLPIAKFILKSTGKILNGVESFHISRNFSLETKQWVFDNSDMKNDDLENDSDLPKDVTFKLSLSKAEQQQRNKLVMPYTPVKLDVKIDNDTKNIDHNPQIFYEPDEEDDFDDEDPDDDLEF